MSLFNLSSQDFRQERTAQGSILGITLSGITVVLYYSARNSPPCMQFLPYYQQLPGTIPGCQFAAVDVGRERAVVRMADGTPFPINFVPYIILYVNGRPYRPYGGKRSIRELQQFIVTSIQALQQQYQSSPRNQTMHANQQHRVKKRYPLGIPYNLIDVDDYMLARRTYRRNAYKAHANSINERALSAV